MKIVSRVFDRLTQVNEVVESDGNTGIDFYPNSRAKVPGWDGDVPVRLIKAQFNPKDQTLILLWNIDAAGIAAMDDPPTRITECPDCGGKLWEGWFPTDGYRTRLEHETGCPNF